MKTRAEFRDFATDDGICRVDDTDEWKIRNIINGRFTRLDASFDEQPGISAVHHCCVLGIDAPESLQDLYDVYSGRFAVLFYNGN